MFWKYKITFYLTLLYVKGEGPSPCKTPNNESAECTLLFSCPVLISALETRKPKSLDFVSKSSCGGTRENPMVCCGTKSTLETSETSPPKSPSPNRNLLPTRQYCGFQHSDDYFHPTNDTIITEFPWIARIVHRNKDRPDEQTDIQCSGSMISHRYVLTSGSCVTHQIYGPHQVVLGEFHSKNDTDCVAEDPLNPECSDPVKIVGVEEAIRHPGFTRRNLIHDIALLRLNKSIYYTEYIRPICLPIPGSKHAKNRDVGLTTGWGEHEKEVVVKKRIFEQLISNRECRKAYEDKYKEDGSSDAWAESQSTILTQSRICTRRIRNNTEFTCNDDGGGPLMFASRHQWQQEGIISFRPAACDQNLPIIYTNVSRYVNWIRETVQP